MYLNAFQAKIQVGTALVKPPIMADTAVLKFARTRQAKLTNSTNNNCNTINREIPVWEIRFHIGDYIQDCLTGAEYTGKSRVYAMETNTSNGGFLPANKKFTATVQTCLTFSVIIHSSSNNSQLDLINFLVVFHQH